MVAAVAVATELPDHVDSGGRDCLQEREARPRPAVKLPRAKPT